MAEGCNKRFFLRCVLNFLSLSLDLCFEKVAHVEQPEGHTSKNICLMCLSLMTDMQELMSFCMLGGAV